MERFLVRKEKAEDQRRPSQSDTSQKPGPSQPDTSQKPGPSQPDTSQKPGPSQPDTSQKPGPSQPDTSQKPGPSQPDTSQKRKLAYPEAQTGEESDKSKPLEEGRSTKQTTEETRSKKKKYHNKFSLSWLSVPEFKGWIQKSKETFQGNELAFCSICNLKITAHKNDLIRHSKSDRHIQLSRAIVTSKNIEDALKVSIPTQQKRAEIKLAGFIAERNLPISTIDDLGELLPDLFPDSKIAKGLALHRTKATAIINNTLGKEFSKRISSKLSPAGNYFSIIMDETTDKGIIKQCAFVVIYFDDDDDKVKTRFLSMREVPTSTANDLVACLKQVLIENEIPIENLVGYSSDTTNVMFGQFHSVVSLLKEEVPHGVFIKCSCHLIHLVASKACLKLPRSIEDLLRNLGSHFSRSFGRQEKLREFQVFFSVEVHKILSLSCTRWLSCKQVVDRVLEQFQVLKAYLTETVFEDPSKTSEEMLLTMNQPFTEVYLEFMSYALGLFTSFNTLFQSESPLLHKVKPEVESLVRNLANNYMKKDAVRGKNIYQIDYKEEVNFIEDDKVYLGMKAEENFYKLKNDPDIPKGELSAFIRNVRAFYIEAIHQLLTRFNLKDPIFNLVRVVDPEVSQKFEEFKTLRPVFEQFKMLQNHVNPADAEQEWRNHSLLDFEDLQLDPNETAVDYWRKVFKLKDGAGNYKFLNLKKVIKLLLILPFSNACVERTFSTLNNVKTANRNRLKTETLNALLSTKEGIEEEGGAVHFEPSASMLKSSVWK